MRSCAGPFGAPTSYPSGLSSDPLARVIEPFDERRHAREDFSCGVESLDRYLRMRARQERDRFVATVFALAEGTSILGYYTLSSYAIDPGELPAEVARRLPRYPRLPATLIGRLAVDLRHRGKGYGEALLVDALTRSFEASAEVGSLAVVVEAENEGAVGFYRSYGFVDFPDHPDRLFLPMATVRSLVRK
jgi:GNAT superfamily N-acetyltransferase